MKKAFLLLLVLIAFYFFSEKALMLHSPTVHRSMSVREASLQQDTVSSHILMGEQSTKIEATSEALVESDRFIKEHTELFPIRPYHQLKGEVIENPLGKRVKYEISQSGIPIVGMEIELQIDTKGKASVLSNNYFPIEKVELDRDHWLSLAEVLEGQEQSLKFTTTEAGRGSDSVVIFVESGKSRGEVAYNVSFLDSNSKNPITAHAVLSATSGQLLARHIARSEF